MAKVRLVNLTKKFGEVVAVRNLNLEIEDGEMISLLGPSGCGKTTTLLMIAGIYQPTQGGIYFDDILVNNVAPRDRQVGLVFQSYALYPLMSVYENIAFPLKLRKEDREEIDRKVKSVAELTRIRELLDRKPEQLSGGQQQRVALCRALVKNPRLLLLDEPLSNLDARLRIETRAEIKRLQKELKITSILVTHDQVEAMTMAERVAVMYEGVLQQFTTPRELYNRPKNLFVASFIGDPPMNLLEVEYRVVNKTPLLESKNFKLTISQPLAQKIEENSSGSQLVLGIRPRDIELYQRRKENAFPGEVYLTESLGGGLLVDFKFEEITLRVIADQDFDTQIGDRLWIFPKLEKIHLFDKKTQKSVLYE